VVAAALAVAGGLCAQDATVNSPGAFQENASKRTTEWSTLATGLEPRLARLLPCDPRVRTSVDEVSRASDARIVAMTSYWTVVSNKSKQQMEAVRQLLAQEEGRIADWAKDQSDAEVEVTAINSQSAALGTGLQHLPALANPQKNLQSIAQMDRTLEAKTQEREASSSEILDDLREQLKASQARQAAIEDHMKAISKEGERWSGYYAARMARAQVECSLINPGAAPLNPPARPASPAKKP
jgi:hypothetical protein